MYLYNAPTKVFIEHDLNKVGEVVKSYGYKKVLLVYGSGSIKVNGLYDTIINSLRENEISYVEASGVEPNPKLSFVREVLSKKYDFEMILAVGGGSVIDAAKSIAVSYKSGLDPWVFNSHEVVPSKALPVGAVLTISAAGSEMSSSCVITNSEINVKQGFNSELIRPLFAFLNPELTYSVSKYQTACGVVDIMMHTLERYINKDKSDLASEFAIGLLKTVMKYGPIAYNEPNNYEARKQLMLASSFSHNGLTHVGRSYFLRAHVFEHIISGLYDEVTHGAGLAIVWPAYAKYIYTNEIALPLFARLAYDLFGVEKTADIARDAYLGIIKMEEFFKSLDMPTRLEEVGINIGELDRLALTLSNNKTKVINDLIPLGYEEMKNIFALMFSEVA